MEATKKLVVGMSIPISPRTKSLCLGEHGFLRYPILLRVLRVKIFCLY